MTTWRPILITALSVATLGISACGKAPAATADPLPAVAAPVAVADASPAAVAPVSATTPAAVGGGVTTPAPTPAPTPPIVHRPLHSRYIEAPPIVQGHVLDCEAAALQTALAAKGVNVSQDWILNVMGADTRAAVVDSRGGVVQWGDPYRSFVGDVDGSEPQHTGYGVYYPPIAAAARRAGRPAVGAEHWTAADIYTHLSNGDPVVVWSNSRFQPVATSTWTAWDGRQVRYAVGEHASALTGIDVEGQAVRILDVHDGTSRMFAMRDFEAFWSSFGNMAVVVE